MTPVESMFPPLTCLPHESQCALIEGSLIWLLYSSIESAI